MTRALGKYGLTTKKNALPGAFHRLRRAYFNPPKPKGIVRVMKDEFEPVARVMKDEFEPVARVMKDEFDEVIPKVVYKPKGERDHKKEIHQERKRIFIEHILALARRRK